MGVIGTAVGAAGSILGGVAAAISANKVKKNIEAQRKANRNWYDMRYNEDATQRADAQALLSRTEEAIRQRNRATAGAQAVMGGTDESVAAAKAANNQALADAASTIAANAASRKDEIDSAYRAREDDYNKRLDEIQVAKTNAIAQAVGGTLSAAKDMPF